VKRGGEGRGGSGRRYPYNRETEGLPTVPSRPSGEGRCDTIPWNEEGKLMERGLFGVQQREKLAFGERPLK
jgi:hypothetical protein